jgi:hypothetical protein
MRPALIAAALMLAAPLSLAAPAFAQGGYDPAPRIAAQKEAMKALAFLDGEWRGEARTVLQDGKWHTFTQTERVGPMLDGTVKVIEGRGYEADGKVSFNAFAVISYDPDRKTYAMRSYTAGRQGDYTITPTATGFTWDIPAGPNMTIHYEATVKDGSWTEIGTRIPKDDHPVKFIEFTVNRLGDATWPAAGFVKAN